MEFDAIYRDVPDHQRQALRDFRQRHTMQAAAVDGVEWSYYDVGTGEDVILWLVGGLRVADAAFRSIPLLADRFRILAPDYPPLSDMQALADGLAGVLDAAQVGRAHVLAGSFGGKVAQAFARRHPQRVRKLVLSTTGGPSHELLRRYRQQLAMVEGLDEAVVREGARHQLFETMSPPSDEERFWQAYLYELFTQRLGKADIVSTYHCLIQFMQSPVPHPDGPPLPGAHVLLIDSQNDTTFGEEAQRALRQLFPDAHTYTFHDAGHSPASTERDVYFQLVADFLRG